MTSQALTRHTTDCRRRSCVHSARVNTSHSCVGWFNSANCGGIIPQVRAVIRTRGSANRLRTVGAVRELAVSLIRTKENITVNNPSHCVAHEIVERSIAQCIHVCSNVGKHIENEGQYKNQGQHSQNSCEFIVSIHHLRCCGVFFKEGFILELRFSPSTDKDKNTVYKQDGHQIDHPNSRLKSHHIKTRGCNQQTNHLTGRFQQQESLIIFKKIHIPVWEKAIRFCHLRSLHLLVFITPILAQFAHFHNSKRRDDV